MSSTRKVSFHTLGCKLNFSETSTIARAFEQGGFVRSKSGETADIYVINSCSVTDHADKKCRNLIRKLAKENPAGLIVVTGCYAQLKPDEVASIEGVSLVVGNNEKENIFQQVLALTRNEEQPQIHSCSADELTHFFTAFSSGDRTRSFLKVQDGCDYACSYCTIPLARGGSRNRPIAEIVSNAEIIASEGIREIVLTGVNTGDFGRSTGESFLDLLRALNNVEGIERYRISSIEPNLLTDEIIAFTAAAPKFQPHFHIPLQSGSDRVLGRMRRRYNTRMFAERISRVKQSIPDPFIGIDVIVGFPGESEEEFETTYQFLEEVRPAFLHVFPYSVRRNTPAADFPEQVSPQESAKRVKRLAELSHRLHREFGLSQIGKEATVLWEGSRRGGFMFGYTENYLKVRTPYNKELINRFSTVRLESMNEENILEGSLL